MALSNTAVPKYYGEFRDKVLRGEIPVNREVAMQMNRIDELIANPRYYYDSRAIEGYIRFCEEELTLTDGSDMHLLDSFKLWAEDLLSWFYYIDKSVWVPEGEHGKGRYVRKRIKKRLRNKQYIIVARGGAKSMYVSTVQAFFLTVATATTHQITTAPTMAQAEEVMSAFRTAITRARGPWFEFLTEGSLQNTTGSRANRVKLAATKKGIQNFMTGSLLEVRPMTIDKLQGLRVSVASIDEWLSGDVREDVVGAIEQGASKDQGGYSSDEYLILAISSEGTVRNGVGDSIKMELASMLKGEFYAPNVSIWHYKLDDIEEVADPNMWVKAQPNIGKTVSYETYQADVERAEKNPSVRNDIMAKRFGIPMEGYTYFFPYEETLIHRPHNFDGLPCSFGADLSQGDDFCAFTFLFPLGNERFGVKTVSFITDKTLMKLPGAMRQKYETFINEGTLFVLEGTVLDMMEVYDVLDEVILNRGYDVRSFGYDPYNSKEFVDRYISENGSYGVRKVIQGVRTESVPLGELKKLSEGRQLIFDEQLMSFAMGNSIVLEDTNGNRKLYKKRHDFKIDNVAALMDAWVAYKSTPEAY